MNTFKYKARDRNGNIVSGVLSASTVVEAHAILRKQGLNVIPNTLVPAEQKGLKSLLQGKVKLKHLVIFTRQFATLIQAGLPVTQALDLLKKQTESKALRSTLDEIKKKVEAGDNLSDSFSKFPKVFDPLYVNLLQAGEQGGFLDQVLSRLATYLEKYAKLKRELTVALIYPTILLLTAVLVVAVILIFVIPTFKEIFSEFGAALPLPTRIVIEISNFTVQYWYLLLGLLLVITYFAWRFYKSPQGRQFFEPIVLQIPVLGQVILKASIARFSRTLATMLSSGVPIMQALETSAKVSNNALVERGLIAAKRSVSEGKSIHETLNEFPIFPPMVCGMIAVGEQTGSLDLMLEKLAIFYEEEVETAVQSLKQLLEPIMILVIGVIIGGLVVAMYLPIFKIGSVIG